MQGIEEEGRRRGLSDAERFSKRGREQPRRAGHSSAGQSRGEVERTAKRWVDGQRRRPMALPAARVVSRQGESGLECVWAREIALDMQQACARGGGLAGGPTPSGGFVLCSVD